MRPEEIMCGTEAMFTWFVTSDLTPYIIYQTYFWTTHQISVNDKLTLTLYAVQTNETII